MNWFSKVKRVVVGIVAVAAFLLSIGQASEAGEPDPEFGDGGIADVFDGRAGVAFLERSGDSLYALSGGLSPAELEIAKLDSEGRHAEGSPWSLPRRGLPDLFYWGDAEPVGTQPAGREGLLIGGSSRGSMGWRPWLIRLDSSGKLAGRFAGRGLWMSRSSKHLSTRMIDFDVDGHGRIYVLKEAVGLAPAGKRADRARYVIQRLRASGKPDRSFGHRSVVRLLSKPARRAYPWVSDISVSAPGLTRYSVSFSRGSRLGALGVKGHRAIFVGGKRWLPVSGEVVPGWDGLLVLGYRKPSNSVNQTERVITLTKLRRGGVPVTAFGKQGRVRIGRKLIRSMADDSSSGWFLSGDVGVSSQPNGKVVLSIPIRARRTGKPDLLFLRLGKSGRVDQSFGVDGAFQAPAPYPVSANIVLWQNGANVLLIGKPLKTGRAAAPSLVRLNGR